MWQLQFLQFCSLSPRKRFEKTLTPNNLFYHVARWTQSGDAVFFSLARNSKQAIGVAACKAGLWQFPHDNYIWARTNSSGGTLYYDFPTRWGGRFWILVGGTEALYDKAESIVNSYKRYSGPNFYNGNDANPTGVVRRIGRDAVEKLNAGNLKCDENKVKGYLHPDFYGYPHNH
ncbi:MAG: hypothetical protein GF398_17035 [Chitinivibrionales bacterium]|nr:hypothetical protein [Chitinivibrionales bacterium]